jgi:hypothetical protein
MAVHDLDDASLCHGKGNVQAGLQKLIDQAVPAEQLDSFGVHGILAKWCDAEDIANRGWRARGGRRWLSCWMAGWLGGLSS